MAPTQDVGRLQIGEREGHRLWLGVTLSSLLMAKYANKGLSFSDISYYREGIEYSVGSLFVTKDTNTDFLVPSSKVTSHLHTSTCLVSREPWTYANYQADGQEMMFTIESAENMKR